MSSTLQAAPNNTDVITSSGILLVDLNEATAEQLRDIFEIKEDLAQRIVTHRVQATRIFDAKDLLAVEGFNEEMLQRCTSVEEISPNLELQKQLGLQEAGMVPLQNLLEATIKEMKLEGLAVVTPLGLWVAGFLPDRLIQSRLLERIPMTLQDLGDDLSKMKLGETQSFSISSEEYDILIQRAGVLFLVVVQGPDSFENETYEKIEKIRREIVRRYRPRFQLQHHAERTPTDIIFDCPKCDLRIVIDSLAAGYEIDCPRCKVRLIVPDKSLVG